MIVIILALTLLSGLEIYPSPSPNVAYPRELHRVKRKVGFEYASLRFEKELMINRVNNMTF